MVKTLNLAVSLKADSDKNPRRLRAEGFVPAVIYGSGTKNMHIKVRANEIEKIFMHGGESNLIDLSIDGDKNIKVVIKDVQRERLKNHIIHIDFFKVNMKKEIEMEIHLHFTGESKAVKELGGTLVKNAETLLVKCLPEKLVEKIDVDISPLANFEDHIKIKDLKLPEGIEALNESEEIIVSVLEPRTQEEIVEAAPSPEQPAEEAKAEDDKKE